MTLISSKMFSIAGVMSPDSKLAREISELVGRFHDSNRMPTKLNHNDVAATQGLRRNL
jgi:hypothetical protein